MSSQKQDGAFVFVVFNLSSSRLANPFYSTISKKVFSLNFINCKNIMRCINSYPSCQQAACDIVVVLGNRCGYVRNGDGNINIEPINDPTGSLPF